MTLDLDDLLDDAAAELRTSAAGVVSSPSAGADRRRTRRGGLAVAIFVALAVSVGALTSANGMKDAGTVGPATGDDQIVLTDESATESRHAVELGDVLAAAEDSEQVVSLGAVRMSGWDHGACIHDAAGSRCKELGSSPEVWTELVSDVDGNLFLAGAAGGFGELRRFTELDEAEFDEVLVVRERGITFVVASLRRKVLPPEGLSLILVGDGEVARFVAGALSEPTPLMTERMGHELTDGSFFAVVHPDQELLVVADEEVCVVLGSGRRELPCANASHRGTLGSISDPFLGSVLADDVAVVFGGGVGPIKLGDVVARPLSWGNASSEIWWFLVADRPDFHYGTPLQRPGADLDGVAAEVHSNGDVCVLAEERRCFATESTDWVGVDVPSSSGVVRVLVKSWRPLPELLDGEYTVTVKDAVPGFTIAETERDLVLVLNPTQPLPYSQEVPEALQPLRSRERPTG